MDRFDLEQAILAAWSTKEDIDLVFEKVMDGPTMSKDQLSNLLLGISALHGARCEKLFDIFQHLLAEGKIS